MSHLITDGENRKHALIEDIRAAGLEPRLDIIQHSLPDEDVALRIEAALIDILELEALTNEVHGWRYKFPGRSPLTDLIGRYSRPLKIEESCILIRINKLYRSEMSERELYETTRGIWKVGSRRSRAIFALAVFKGVVREVYQIKTWHRAGTTPYESRSFEPEQCVDRWEFIGTVAPEEHRKKFLYGNVADHLSDGAQNPITYVCC